MGKENIMQKHHLIVGATTLLFGLLLSGCTSLNLILTPPNTDTVAPTAVPVEEAAGTDKEADGVMSVMGDAVATVSTPSLRLHRYPDDASAVIGGLVEGESYRVIGISPDGTWVRLEVLDASSGAGWVTARFVSVRGDITDVPITDGTGLASTRPTPAPDSAVVSTDGTRLRVRSGPSTDSEIVTYVYDGDALPVVGVSNDGAWVELNVAGVRGWVAREFLLLEGDAAAAIEAVTGAEEQAQESETASGEDAAADSTATEEAPAEEAPTDEATTENAAAEEGTDESVVAEETAGDAPAVDLPDPIPGQAIVITDGTRLRVRAAASTESEIVGYVENGEAYPILETSDDGLWVKIDIPAIAGGGWVADQFVLTAEAE